MNAATQPEQSAIAGAQTKDSGHHMIVRINSMAAKIVFPFIPKYDIRHNLMGINIRPLDDGSVMIAATDGRRYIVVRDPEGYAENEVTVSVSKEAVKHLGRDKRTIDVLSNGTMQVTDTHAEPVFIQPGCAVITDSYPRIERIASMTGYKEGISGAFNPLYLQAALDVARYFGNSIRFYHRDENSPLNFVIGGMLNLECFGGIMKMNETEGIPSWMPKPTEPSSLADI